MYRHTIPQTSFPEFVGRKEEIDLLTKALISGKAKVASIIGTRGVGKTSLAHIFAQIFEERTLGNAGFFNANPFTPIADVVLRELWDSVRTPLSIIDDFDLVPESDRDSEIRRILSVKPKLKLLLVSQNRIQSPLIDLTISLNNFSQAEMRELLSKRFNSRLDESEIRKLYSKLQGNPLAANLAGDLLHNDILTIDQILEALKPFELSSLVDPTGKPLTPESQPYNAIVSDVIVVSEELLRKLTDNPELLYDLSPRLFEEVVADLFHRQGYDVTLTQASKDGGKDIYVASKGLLGSFLYIVECKKYAPDHPVGVGLVRQLYGVVQAEKATAGILATTSFFTKGAKEFQQQIPFQLSLQDYFGIQKWLKGIQQKY